jgi:ribosomal protein L11 methyltransferase
LIRLAVRVRRAQAELVLAELLELAPGGVEEIEMGDTVEYAVYGAPGELPTLPDLRAAAGGALVEVATSEIADDWAERWRDFHRPVTVGEALTVRAPWHDPATTGLDIVIDPGQAFGTGAHATTRLCLELMTGLEATGPFLDIGCGSGVLAIVAARLGFAPVLAFDSDPAALRAAESNAAANRAALEVRRFDLRHEPVPPATTVAANLLAPLLRSWAGSVHRSTRRVIASGILTAEADAVATAFGAAGLREAARRENAEWTALLLER